MWKRLGATYSELRGGSVGLIKFTFLWHLARQEKRLICRQEIRVWILTTPQSSMAGKNWPYSLGGKDGVLSPMSITVTLGLFSCRYRCAHVCGRGQITLSSPWYNMSMNAKLWHSRDISSILWQRAYLCMLCSLLNVLFDTRTCWIKSLVSNNTAILHKACLFRARSCWTCPGPRLLFFLVIGELTILFPSSRTRQRTRSCTELPRTSGFTHLIRAL